MCDEEQIMARPTSVERETPGRFSLATEEEPRPSTATSGSDDRTQPGDLPGPAYDEFWD